MASTKTREDTALSPAGRGSRQSKRGPWTPLLWTTRIILSLLLLAPPAFILGVSSEARDWALSSLGYGLFPVALWLACFVIVLIYKTSWIKRGWQIWVGTASLAAGSIGVLSMFHASGGVMEDASLGGYWGQYLGGTPVVLGGLKVAGIILISPLLIIPVRAQRIYRLAARNFALACAAASKWLAPRTYRGGKSSARWLLAETEEGKKGRLIRWVSAPLGMLRRVRIPRPGRFRTSVAVDITPPEESHADAPAAEGEDARKPRPRADRTNADGWQLPSMEMLSKGESRTIPDDVLQKMAQHIEETLGEHKVEVAVGDIRTGPRVIMFGLVPGWMKKYKETKGGKAGNTPNTEMSRVKVQSILMREKDLALALKTPYLRIEAPVPGEALVGLEVPNPYPSRVVVRSVAESQAFQDLAAKGGLPVALGEDTGGESVVSDLTGLPHLLIAGATGSGKSVCINTVVVSLLMTNGPDRLRMLMVDPKRVELTPFNGIPHLIAPVIVDTDEVLVALKAVQNEMFRRYKLMEQIGVRNFDGYNKKATDNPMPYLVIVIDELADLMMAAAYEVEQSLVRLAQLGRATGIHIIVATQRPSVNVVTGLLKANVPGRIAFAVASQVDSRVILDGVGAEKLLGKGDMLLLTNDSPKPKRVQGTFVHDREIEELVEFWRAPSRVPRCLRYPWTTSLWTRRCRRSPAVKRTTCSKGRASLPGGIITFRPRCSSEGSRWDTR